MSKRKFGVFFQEDDKFSNSNQNNLPHESEPSSNSVAESKFFRPYNPSQFGQSFRCRDNLEEIQKPNQKAQSAIVDGINFENFHIQSGSFSSENKSISDDAKEILKYVQKLREEKTLLISQLAQQIGRFKKDLEEAKIENVELKQKLTEIGLGDGRENQYWNLPASSIEKYQKIKKTYKSIVETYDGLNRSIAKINDDYSTIKNHFKEEMNNLEKQIDAYRMNYAELKNKYLEDSEKYKQELEVSNKTLQELQLQMLEVEAEKEKVLKDHDDETNELLEIINKLIGQLEDWKEKKIKSTEELQELFESNQRIAFKINEIENQLKPDVSEETVSHLQSSISIIKYLEKNQDLDIEKIESWREKNIDLEQKYEKLEEESFKLVEDVRILYFTVKDLKLKEEVFSNEKKSFSTEIQQKQQQIAILERDLEQCKNEIIDLHEKSKKNDEIHATFRAVTENLQKLAESKEKMYQEKNEEKDQIIANLKQKNAEYLEKSRLIQLEKDNLFRNFHEFVLNAQRQTSSLSVSSVTPIIKADCKDPSFVAQSPVKKIENFSIATTRDETKSFNASSCTKAVGDYSDGKMIVIEKESIIKPASPYCVQRKKIKLNSSSRGTDHLLKSSIIEEEKEEEIKKEKKASPKTVTFSSDVVDNEKSSTKKPEKSSRQPRRASLMLSEGKEFKQNSVNNSINGGSWINEDIFEF